jgi:ribosomal protein S18 acetylase RimI-like enzyme
MTRIIVRKMREDDLPTVSELAMLANPHATKEKYREHIAVELKDNPDLSFVATVEGKVVGYAQAEVCDNNEALLEDIAVAEEYQKKGIGKQLLSKEAMVLKQNGARIMLAEVHYKCASAIPFYYKHDFRVSGFDQDYFGIGHDAVILKKVLQM